MWASETYCNFENGLCRWQQEKLPGYSDTFHWLRQHGPTPTGLTGPDADHTYGFSRKGLLPLYYCEHS